MLEDRNEEGDVFLRFLLFFFNDTATTEIYTLSLHDALPISNRGGRRSRLNPEQYPGPRLLVRSEEHTSELQSQSNLVCRLLLEKNQTKHQHHRTVRSMLWGAQRLCRTTGD